MWVVALSLATMQVVLPEAAECKIVWWGVQQLQALPACSESLRPFLLTCTLRLSRPGQVLIKLPHQEKTERGRISCIIVFWVVEPEEWGRYEVIMSRLFFPSNWITRRKTGSLIQITEMLFA